MEYEFDHSATRITKMTGSKTNGKIKHLLLFTFYVNNKPNTVPENSNVAIFSGFTILKPKVDFRLWQKFRAYKKFLMKIGTQTENFMLCLVVKMKNFQFIRKLLLFSFF